MRGLIVTVTGPMAASEMGLTLPPEHVMCDFIGDEQTGPHPWDQDEVVAVIEPYIREIAELGVRTFVDCSPMYIARDPLVLAELSRRTGVRFVTNTGMYKEPFLPASASDRSAEQLADDWTSEFEGGIGNTGIRPGFIKTAVTPGELAPMQQKMIRAAAIAAGRTGLPIATHTGFALPARQILQILESEGIDPSRWIFVHAQNEPDIQALIQIAARGAWIELDGLSPASSEQHLAHLMPLLEAGYRHRLLLSHDAGWYRVGEQRGGTVRGYSFLFTDFLPLLRQRGIDRATIDAITVANPGRAFALAA